ncbi:MAG: alpha/beta hydrolase family protein [Myxococcota bacterium]
MVLALALGCVSLGCGDDDRPLAPMEFGEPDEPGPFPVGVTEVEIDDGQDDGRTLPVLIWYPAHPPRGAGAYEYVLSLEAAELARLESPMGAVEAAPVDPRGPWPIVVFSHGNGGINAQSFYMTEWLASHGFIVAAPDHVGNTIIEEITDSGLSMTEAAFLRPTDASRALDAVFRESDDPGSLLADAADPARVGISGHSFGGFTTFRVAGATIDQALLEEECAMGTAPDLCAELDSIDFPASQRDDRFIAALPQAPGGAAVMMPGMGFEDVAIPTMVQAGDMDMTTPYIEESVEPYQQLTVESSLMVLGDAGHFSFSDMCRLLEVIDPAFEDLASDALEDGCGPDNLDWMRAQELINEYATDFFHTHVSMREGFGDRLDPERAHPSEVVDFQSK